MFCFHELLTMVARIPVIQLVTVMLKEMALKITYHIAENVLSLLTATNPITRSMVTDPSKYVSGTVDQKNADALTAARVENNIASR